MARQEDNCIFCKIISGVLPAQYLLWTADTVVIADRAPKATHHFLIIPTTHTANVLTVADQDHAIFSQLFLTAQRIAQERNLVDFRLIVNNGRQSGQSVFHLHMHFLSGLAIPAVTSLDL
jgi:histidine triad (HIT) family protein